ncbi:hypothetical protein FA13DRAFT_1862499 [Coprinellus micaceus]|uniref:Uncharacterized protein n=1 Tax=Coprinellus micaceus TaxID=71717 RepID=A0A4Y7T825_COPMI|nr:hypothetical protein FA13DRAFT_1862499 [Coprinellus micaceus]
MRACAFPSPLSPLSRPAVLPAPLRATPASAHPSHRMAKLSEAPGQGQQMWSERTWARIPFSSEYFGVLHRSKAGSGDSKPPTLQRSFCPQKKLSAETRSAALAGAYQSAQGSIVSGSWLESQGSKDQEDRVYGGTRTTVPPSARGYWPVLISTSAEAHVGLYRYIVIPIPESLALERRCRENSSKPPRCGDLYLPGVAVRLPLSLWG